MLKVRKRTLFIGILIGIGLIGNSKGLLASEGINQSTVQNEQKSEFIFETTDKIELTEMELITLEPETLAFARNEIYARHGYIFKEDKYNKYFKTKTWYKPVQGFSYDALNVVEKYNINIIKFYEKSYDYYSKIPVSIKAVSKEDIYDASKKILIDLNGDGVKEKIEYKLLSTTEYGENEKGTLTVNDSILTLEGNLASKFAIVDINKKDKYKEIIVSDYGPSSDHTSTFYIYQNKKLTSIGITGGLFDDGITIEKSGTFLASTRGNILQTWWFDKRFQLDKNHKIIPVPTEVYTNNHPIYVKKDFKLYTKKDVKSNKFQVKAGAFLIITGNDNKGWCRVKTEDHKEGWFRVKNFSFMPDEKAEAQTIFAGLIYAD